MKSGIIQFLVEVIGKIISLLLNKPLKKEENYNATGKADKPDDNGAFTPDDF